MIGIAAVTGLLGIMGLIVFLIIAVVAGVGAYFVNLNANLEYEYLYVDCLLYTSGLGEAIRRSLRSGDVYTQYSSCQFLLMVMGTSLENAWKVVERIRNHN